MQTSNAPELFLPSCALLVSHPPPPHYCGIQGLPFVLPADTFDRLYPYQQKGVAWMARLEEP